MSLRISGETNKGQRGHILKLGWALQTWRTKKKKPQHGWKWLNRRSKRRGRWLRLHSHLHWVNCASPFDDGAILVLCWSSAMAKWTERIACSFDWRLEKVCHTTVVLAFCHKAEIDAKVGLLHPLRPGQLCQEWLAEADPLILTHIWGSEEVMLLTLGGGLQYGLIVTVLNPYRTR